MRKAMRAGAVGAGLKRCGRAMGLAALLLGTSGLLGISGLLGASGSALASAREPLVEPLVSAEWLSQRLGDADLKVLDIRSAIDGGGDRATFAQAHIPGSRYSNYTEDGWRETRDGVAGVLPPVASLEHLIGGLGIDNDDTVVVVPAGTGATDFGSAARVYWTFKVLGHEAVTILDGGFAGWRAQGYAVADGAGGPVEPAAFQGALDPTLLATTEEVEAARQRQAQLIDARPADYFRGEAQSPAARAPGTIPGARNLPHHSLLRQGEGAWYLDRAGLAERIQAAELSRDLPTVSFCNTGHWAATDWFVLSEVAGFEDVKLYDGSMAAWTQDESRPLAVARRGLGRLLELLE